MTDDNPWTDDRAEQQSLFGDQEATRTIDREGQTVTGSSSFADDRDHQDQTETDQSGLFQQEQELENQMSLSGDQATREESSGFFEPEEEIGDEPLDPFPDTQQPNPIFDEIDDRIEAADSAGVLDPDPPNGDREHAPDDIFGAGSTRQIEFGRRDAAQEARQIVEDQALTDSFDGRHKTLEVREDRIDDRTFDRLSGMAADSKAHREERTGQVPLSDEERRQIDFTETTVVEARSAKGILLDEGVEDFVGFFDPTLTVDEHRDIAQQAARDDGGRRRDTDDSAVEKEARAHQRAESELRDHAIKGAKMGDEEAIRTLIDEVGMDPDRARGFSKAASSPEERAHIVSTVIGRATANGRFVRRPVDPAPNSPGNRKPSTGRYIGNEVVSADPDRPIKRDSRTGKFLVKTNE